MKYYYTYEIFIENKDSSLNGCYYYGKHSTSSLNDKYYGSGKIIKNYISKYGCIGLQKTILKFYTNDKELENAEAILIKEKKDILKDKCLNLYIGSTGGWDNVNHNIWNMLSAEEKSERMRKMALAKNNVSIKQKQIRSEHFKEMHRNMSIEDKQNRYRKVSESEKAYYKNASADELMLRKLKNKESNIRSAKEWRIDFFNLFGHTPEFFRKFNKFKEVHILFKQIKNLSLEEKQNEANRFMESINI